MNKQIIKDYLNYSRKTKAVTSQAVYEELLSRIGQLELTKTTCVEITSAEIISILNKMKSEREAAIELYNKADRKELSKRLQDEIIVINNNIPISTIIYLSNEDTEKLIDEYIRNNGFTFKKTKGDIIKTLKQSHTNLNMKVVSTILDSKLI